MRKKEKRTESGGRRTGGFPALILFMSGFLAGSLLPNIFWRMEWRRMTMSALYLLDAFARGSVSGKAYLKEILYMRGSVWILCAVCGFSVFGVPVAVVTAVLAGAGVGALLAMSVLEFGFSGGLVGLALLFPQYLLYIPALLFLLGDCYDLSLGVWKNRGIFPAKAGSCGVTALLGGLATMGGILLECYVNPSVVEAVMKVLKIF